MAYKRLIEHRLPLNEVSTESAREKSIRHGHISTLHIWWARRPLAASRAAVFATLVPDTDENYELVKKIVPWEAVKDGNSPDILEARRRVLEANGGIPPKVLDPFGGGGAIPLEALRLGCEVYSLDLNPVAHIIQKATLEFPQKYGQPNSRPVPEYIREKDQQAVASATARASKANKGKASKQVSMFGDDSDGEWAKAYRQNPLATDVRYWGEWVLEKAREELQDIYPSEPDGRIPLAYLWARTVTCSNPGCRAEVPMLKTYWISNTSRQKYALQPMINDNELTFSLVTPEKGAKWPEEGSVTDATVICPICTASTTKSDIQNQAQDRGFGDRLLCVVTQSFTEDGRGYRLPNELDFAALQTAKDKFNTLERLNEARYPKEDIPDEKIWRNSAVRVRGYGFKKWSQFFTERQKVSLSIFSKLISSVKLDSEDTGYEDAVKTELAVSFDRLANSNSSFSRWENGREKIQGVFARQSISMLWDYVEANPIGNATGDWQSAVGWVSKANDFAARSSSHYATILRGSAEKIPLEDSSIDAIITDPPYYDAVPYSGLSDYFYVWLKINVPASLALHFRTPLTPKSGEIVQNPSRHNGDREAAKLYYERLMSNSFSEMHRVLKESGEATIVFAHKSTEAWETLIAALIKAGFLVQASWPLKTEMQGRTVSHNAAALASSTFLNCTKRTAGGVGYFNDVRRDMIAAIQPQLAEFWASGIRGADFFMSAIGPGLEAYSRHDEVRRVSGEVVSVGEFLDEVRKIVMEFALGQVLGAKSMGAVDAPTQFALLSLWGYGPELPSDEARKLAQSVGRELTDIQDSGLVVVKGEKATVQGLKARSKDKALGLSKSGEKVPMVDAMHKAVTLLGGGSRQAVADYLSAVGYLPEEAFWQTMQALAEVQDGVDDGRALHELLTIREGLPKPSGNPLETLFGGQA
ncbi:DUF1156 domain-containing protein [Deinococcus fonticola]|uniref:DUF1156 domain-containing protein n=1 Tax=Deinococcus fonticola TaxID=2528713 RepID=UPI001074FC26|nr:DUF1156 domain-containing protein [Deinococcus fonticola]